MVNLGLVRYLAWSRAGLAVVALALTLIFPPTNGLFYGVAGVFLLCAIAALVWPQPLARPIGRLALAVDAAFLVSIAVFQSERFLWEAVILLLLLFFEASLLFHSLEVVSVAGVCIVAGLSLSSPVLTSLLPAMVVGGAMALAFTTCRDRQAAANESAGQRATEAEKAARKAREEERQRIASDFHDGPLQNFIALQMRLDILKKMIERDYDVGMADLAELQRVAQEQVRDLRTFLHSMRPVDVDGANFIASARRMTESFQKESGIPVTFLGADGPVGLPPEAGAETLQMLRESLVNVRKHAGATRVAVSIEKSPQGIEISIEDNGHGFSFSGNYTLEELELLRLGPASLKRRARSLNANLVLESRPGRGAGVKFRIPVE